MSNNEVKLEYRSRKIFRLSKPQSLFYVNLSPSCWKLLKLAGAYSAPR